VTSINILLALSRRESVAGAKPGARSSPVGFTIWMAGGGKVVEAILA
jgi:hypothetical protein